MEFCTAARGSCGNFRKEILDRSQFIQWLVNGLRWLFERVWIERIFTRIGLASLWQLFWQRILGPELSEH